MLPLAEHNQEHVQQSNADPTKCLGLLYCSFVKIMYTEMDDKQDDHHHHHDSFKPCQDIGCLHV